MGDAQKTKKQLIDELHATRCRLAELESRNDPQGQVEDTLRQARDRSIRYLDIVEVMLVALDVDESVSLINRKGCSVLGYREDQIRGENWFDRFLPESIRERERRAFRRLVAGDVAPTEYFENPILTASGEERIIAWHNSVLRDDAGRVVSTLSSGEDVTDRRRAEKALQQSEASFRELVDTLVAAVFIYSGTSMRYVNSTGISMTGYSLEEFKRMSFWDVIHPEHRQLVKERGLARQRGENAPGRYEVKIQRKNGEIRWVDFGASIIEFEGRPAVLGIAYDITNRLHASEALRESQRALTTLMANLPGMAYRCRNDEHWTMEIVSEGCFDVTGYQQQDLLLNRKVAFSDLVHPDDRGPVWDDVQKGVDRNAPFQLVYRIIHASGEVRWIWEQGRGIFDENGNLLALEGFMTDITDRKKAEQSLERARSDLEKRVTERTADLTTANEQLQREIAEREHVEAKVRESSAQSAALADELKTLLLHTRDFVYRHDTDGVFTYLSPAIEQITGYAPEDWQQHYTRYMTDSAINDKVALYTEEALRTGKETAPYLVEIRHKNGHAITLEVNERPYHEEGRVSGIIGVARDVTERVRAETALRESEERLHAILDNAAAAVCLKDLDGRYLLVNRLFEEWMHLDKGMALGKMGEEFLPATIAVHARALHDEVVETGHAISVESCMPDDGAMRTCLTVEFPIRDSDGRLYAIGCISTDISNRKQAEEQLREAKETAETANLAKSAFLANISHEIRTPITAVLGAAELLALGRDEPAKQSSRIDIILRNVRHLLLLIDDLLDLSMLDAGKLDIQLVECSLLDLMADIEAVARPLQPRQNIDFRIVYESRLPSKIKTDPTRLKQAVINLVSNAFKFTQSGHVRVRPRILTDGPEPRLSISVEDTGIGIPKDDINRIFETFSRLDTPLSEHSGGVGLGLPLARWIAEQLDGSLQVESEVGRGSTFTINIAIGPLHDVTWITPDDAARPSLADELRAAERATTRLSGTVLLAENARDTRDLLDYALTTAGAQVTAVSNGKEAVAQAIKNRFDLILLDIRMPTQDGLSAVKEMRANGLLVPIIALTASVARNQRSRIMEAGFDDLWPKPLSITRLIEASSAYLCRKEPVEPPAPPPHRTDIGERLAPVIAEFRRGLASRFDTLRQCVQRADKDGTLDILHQLTGAAGIFGHMPLSDEAARLTGLMRAQDSPLRLDDLAALQDLVEQASQTPTDLPADSPTARSGKESGDSA